MVRTHFPNDYMWCSEVMGVTNNHHIAQIDRKLLVKHNIKDFLISLPIFVDDLKQNEFIRNKKKITNNYKGIEKFWWNNHLQFLMVKNLGLINWTWIDWSKYQPWVWLHNVPRPSRSPRNSVKNFKKWFYNVYNEIEKNQEISNQKIRIQRKLQSDVRLALGLNC